MRSVPDNNKEEAAEEAAERGVGSNLFLKAVEEAAEQGDGSHLFLRAVEEAAEQGDGSNLFAVLLGSLSRLTIHATAADQAADDPRDSCGSEGSLLPTDVRLLLCERPCTACDPHDLHLVRGQSIRCTAGEHPSL